jgi:hypothetical protein
MRSQRVRIPGSLKKRAEAIRETLENPGACSDLGIRLEDVNKHCLTEFRKHWECLDNSNQQLWQCRKWERPLNKCVFDNLVRDACGCAPNYQRIGWITNKQTEVGEEDTRCTCT